MAQAALVLANYEEDVVRYVTHPMTGLQSRLKFPPTISEITEACNLRVAAKIKEADLEAWRERKRRSDEIKALGGPRYSAHEAGMTYGEFLAYCEEHKIEPKPMNRFESQKYISGGKEEKR